MKTNTNRIHRNATKKHTDSQIETKLINWMGKVEDEHLTPNEKRDIKKLLKTTDGWSRQEQFELAFVLARRAFLIHSHILKINIEVSFN
jgi:hypothetical protein